MRNMKIIFFICCLCITSYTSAKSLYMELYQGYLYALDKDNIYNYITTANPDSNIIIPPQDLNAFFQASPLVIRINCNPNTSYNMNFSLPDSLYGKGGTKIQCFFHPDALVDDYGSKYDPNEQIHFFGNIFGI